MAAGRPKSLPDLSLRPYAEFAWRRRARLRQVWVIRYRFGRDRLSTNVRFASIPTVNSGLWDLSRCAKSRHLRMDHGGGIFSNFGIELEIADPRLL